MEGFENVKITFGTFEFEGFYECDECDEDDDDNECDVVRSQ